MVMCTFCHLHSQWGATGKFITLTDTASVSIVISCQKEVTITSKTQSTHKAIKNGLK